MVPITFESLRNYLPDAIDKIETKAINSETGDKIGYKKSSPKNVIAVGGNRLSRGFTLEGLSITYFVRTTNYSDTLLQMGRWFGYRPGYLDCCKNFITSDSIDKFNSTTRCIEELETEFRKMEAQDKSPENCVVRVKKHPGVLKITRPSILKNTIDVKWSFQDQLEMTTQFDIHKENISAVWESFRSSLVPKFNKGEKNRGFLTFDTNADGLIEILEATTNYPPDVARSLIQFVRLCKNNNLLTNWRIALKTTGQANVSKGKGVVKKEESGLSEDVVLAIRSGPSEKALIHRDDFLKKNIFRATGSSANIMTAPTDMSLALDTLDIDKAVAKFKRETTAKLKHDKPSLSDEAILELVNKKKPPERVYREAMPETQGLMVIYLFDSYYSFNQEKGAEQTSFSRFVNEGGHDLNIPLVGFALGFPPIENDPGGIYVQGDYNLDIDEESANNFDSEDSILPVEEE